MLEHRDWLRGGQQGSCEGAHLAQASVVEKVEVGWADGLGGLGGQGIQIPDRDPVQVAVVLRPSQVEVAGLGAVLLPELPGQQEQVANRPQGTRMSTHWYYG